MAERSDVIAWRTISVKSGVELQKLGVKFTRKVVVYSEEKSISRRGDA